MDDTILKIFILTSVYCLSSAKPLHLRNAKYDTDMQPAFQNGVFGLGFQLNVRPPIMNIRLPDIRNMHFMGPSLSVFKPKIVTIVPRRGDSENHLTANIDSKEKSSVNQKDAPINTDDILKKNEPKLEDVTTEKETAYTTEDTTETVYETTTDIEFTTLFDDDGLLNRSGLSSQVLASLVG